RAAVDEVLAPVAGCDGVAPGGMPKPGSGSPASSGGAASYHGSYGGSSSKVGHASWSGFAGITRPPYESATTPGPPSTARGRCWTRHGLVCSRPLRLVWGRPTNAGRGDRATVAGSDGGGNGVWRNGGRGRQGWHHSGRRNGGRRH